VKKSSTKKQSTFDLWTSKNPETDTTSIESGMKKEISILTKDNLDAKTVDLTLKDEILHDIIQNTAATKNVQGEGSNIFDSDKRDAVTTENISDKSEAPSPKKGLIGKKGELSPKKYRDAEMRCPYCRGMDIGYFSRDNSRYRCKNCKRVFTYNGFNRINKLKWPWYMPVSVIALRSGSGKTLSYMHTSQILNNFLNLRDEIYKEDDNGANMKVKKKVNSDLVLGWCKVIGLQNVEWTKLLADIHGLRGKYIWCIRSCKVMDKKKNLNITAVIGIDPHVKGKVILGSCVNTTDDRIADVKQAVNLALTRGAPSPSFVIFSDIEFPTCGINSKNALIDALSKTVGLENSRIQCWKVLFRNEIELRKCITELFIPDIFPGCR